MIILEQRQPLMQQLGKPLRILPQSIDLVREEQDQILRVDRHPPFQYILIY